MISTSVWLVVAAAPSATPSAAACTTSPRNQMTCENQNYMQAQLYNFNYGYREVSQ